MLTVEKEMNYKSVITYSNGNVAAAIVCYTVLVTMHCYSLICNPAQEKLISTQSFDPFIFSLNAEIGRVNNLSAFQKQQINAKSVKEPTNIAAGIALSSPGINGKVTLSEIRETGGQI